MQAPRAQNAKQRRQFRPLWQKLLGTVALAFALLISRFTHGAQTPAARPFSERAGEVKKAIDQLSPSDRASFAPSVMQWGNWGNWNNWRDWGNWNNWNNWANWINW